MQEVAHPGSNPIHNGCSGSSTLIPYLVLPVLVFVGGGGFGASAPRVTKGAPEKEDKGKERERKDRKKEGKKEKDKST